MFPQHFCDLVATGQYSDRITAFAKQRLGRDPEGRPDYQLVIAQMAKAGEIDVDHPAVAHGFDAGDTSLEARMALAMLRGKNRI